MWMLYAAVRVAGAISFCETYPDHDECRGRDVRPVLVDEAGRRELGRVHLGMQQGYRRPRSGQQEGDRGRGGDRWRSLPEGRRPGSNDDCEERVLWGLRELRRGPLGPGSRPVLLRRARSSEPSRAHLVLGVETPEGAVVLDPGDGTVRSLASYGRDVEAYVPERGVGGSWVRR